MRYVQMNEKQGISVFSWVMYVLAGLAVITIVAYLFYAFGDYEGKKVISTTLWITGGLALVLIVGIFLYRYLRGSVADADLPKEIVDTTVAIKTWTEAFIRGTNIPYVENHWEDDAYKFKPVNRKAVQITNERPFVDPDKGTADQFYRFQARILEGDRTGIHTVIIPLDKGVEFIKNNWRYLIEDHTAVNVFKLKNQTYPLTSSRSAQERIQIAALEAAAEGFTADEIRRAYDPFLNNGGTTQPQTVIVQPPERAVKRPSFVQDDVDEDIAEEAQEELEQHIEDVRKSQR